MSHEPYGLAHCLVETRISLTVDECLAKVFASVSFPGHFISKICHCTNERRRREDRGTEGAEGVGVWGGGVPLPSRLGGLGERRQLPHAAGSGAELRPQTNLLNFIGPQVASD